MLYERTAISKKPEELVKKELSALRDEDRLTPDLVFRDPYFLDFLGLNLYFAPEKLNCRIYASFCQ
jgi:predicted nuclease of restriction endonuclease-like (RecB) superfamily